MVDRYFSDLDSSTVSWIVNPFKCEIAMIPEEPWWLYNGPNLSEWKSAIVDVLTALGVKHYIDRVFLDGDPEFDKYLRIGAFIRLTFEFKFKKAIEKYRIYRIITMKIVILKN